MTPFDYVKSILNKKRFDFFDKKEYTIPVVNRALAAHEDCIHFVNDINLYGVDEEMHYEYLFSSIRKAYRPFKEWQKNEVKETADVVMEYYDIGFEKALEYISILDNEQIKQMRNVVKNECKNSNPGQ
jgi:dimeric dUTPase (all-alpha-NTP-PPase superfamily)